MKNRLVFLCMLWTLTFASNAFAERPSWDKSSPDCGIACVYTLYVSYAEEEPEPYSEFVSKHAAFAGGDVTTDQLAEICREQGLHAEAIQIAGIEQLSDLASKFSMIVIVDESHFFVVESASRWGLNLLDPPVSQVRCSPQEFITHFRGKAVLVSDEEITLAAKTSWLIPLLCASFVLLVCGISLYLRRTSK